MAQSNPIQIRRWWEIVSVMGVFRWCDSELFFTHSKLPQVRIGHQAEPRPARTSLAPAHLHSIAFSVASER
jgi:hypothetical protein